MKKILLLLLILGLILGILSACNTHNTDSINDTTNTEAQTQISMETKSEITAEEFIVDTTTEELIADTTEMLSFPNIDDIIQIYDPTLGEFYINNVGDRYYIQFLSYETEFSPSFGDGEPGIIFDSWNSFKNCLTNDVLTPYDRDEMKQGWERSENGIEIIDLNNLYYPTLPNDIELDSAIRWQQYNYTVEFVGDESFGFVIVATTEESYMDLYQKYTALHNDEDLVETYTLENEDKHISVMRQYQSFSNTSYYQYELWMETETRYAYIQLRVKELVPDDYILSFGLEKYEG